MPKLPGSSDKIGVRGQILKGTDLTKFANILKGQLFPLQKQLCYESGSRVAALCGRRSGKTMGVMRYMLARCCDTPKSVVGYFADTLTQARKLIWDGPEGIPALLEDLGMVGPNGVCILNEAEHRINFINGSVLWIAGAETLGDAHRWKGQYYTVAVIDEVQDQKTEIFEYLLDTVLSPALLKIKKKQFEGKETQIILTGTPHPICAGRWYDITAGENPAFKRWTTRTWTAHSNPFVENPEDHIKFEAAERGLGIEDPIIQREYFAKWVKDTKSTLYSYMPVRNDFTGSLPDVGKPWQYIIGIDMGFINLFAIVALAWNTNSKQVYILELEGLEGADVTRSAEVINSFRQKYPGAQVIGDCGSQGRQIAEEMRNRHHIPLEAADKPSKPTHIRFMNDAFRRGFIKVDAIECKPLIAEWLRLQMDPKTQREKEGQQSDYSDAALYAWHKTFAYMSSDTAPLKLDKEARRRQWILDQEKEAEARIDKRLSEKIAALSDSDTPKAYTDDVLESHLWDF